MIALMYDNINQSRWRSDKNYLYSVFSVKVEVYMILPLLIYAVIYNHERSYELVSKDKLARRRRAAFDISE